MTSSAADAARAAAAILVSDLGPALVVQVEAALHAAAQDGQHEDDEWRPERYDPLAIAGFGVTVASLIVIIAQLAWSIRTDQRKHAVEPSHAGPSHGEQSHAEPSHEAITREVRITLREKDLRLPAGTEHITDVVVTEVIRLANESR